jgi:L,D-transpeptidase ErfK/SrfK
MENPVYVVPPGPDNPLGKHRIKLSIESYLLHGTNDPWSVGRLTTHGCVRFYPEDVEQLYGLVYPGYPGQFIYQPVKVTELDGRVYLEVHRDIYLRVDDLEAHARAEIARAGLTSRVDSAAVSAAVEAQNGMPLDVTLAPTRTAVTE